MMFKDYKSPIDLIIGEMQTQIDDDIVKAVQAYDICVNKDELIKALNYDRGQYQNGYKNGFNDAKQHGKWIEHEDCTGTFNKCSNCGAGGLVNKFPYCPWCGCQMDLD